MLRISVVLDFIQSTTYSICSLFSFSSFDFTTSAGYVSLATVNSLRDVHTVSVIISIISLSMPTSFFSFCAKISYSIFSLTSYLYFDILSAPINSAFADWIG